MNISQEAYNPTTRKQVILMRKNISITTYNYKVYIEKYCKILHIKRQK